MMFSCVSSSLIMQCTKFFYDLKIMYNTQKKFNLQFIIVVMKQKASHRFYVRPVKCDDECGNEWEMLQSNFWLLLHMKCFPFEAFAAAAHNVEKERKMRNEKRTREMKTGTCDNNNKRDLNDFSRFLDHTQQQPAKSTHSRNEISPTKSGECFSIIE